MADFLGRVRRGMLRGGSKPARRSMVRSVVCRRRLASCSGVGCVRISPPWISDNVVLSIAVDIEAWLLNLTLIVVRISNIVKQRTCEKRSSSGGCQALLKQAHRSITVTTRRLLNSMLGSVGMQRMLPSICMQRWSLRLISLTR